MGLTEKRRNEIKNEAEAGIAYADEVGIQRSDRDVDRLDLLAALAESEKIRLEAERERDRHPGEADLAYAPPDGRFSGIVVGKWLIQSGEVIDHIRHLEEENGRLGDDRLLGITGIWLRTRGDHIQTLLEVNGVWRLIHDEATGEHLPPISHITEPAGIRERRPDPVTEVR